MESIPGTIDTFIEYKGAKMPFGIQPRCRLKRLKEVVGKALRIQVKEVTLKPLRSDFCSEKIKILEGDELFLIEDHGASEKAVLVVKGDLDSSETVAEFNYPMLTTTFVDEKGQTLFSDVKVSTTCSVKILTDMIKQTRLYIPDSISLWVQGRRLCPSEIVSKVVGSSRGQLMLKGSMFPLALFEGLDFAENVGLYPELRMLRLSRGIYFEEGL